MVKKEDLVARLEKADQDVRQAWGTRAGNLYGEAAASLRRWQWLKEDATSAQWERASRALDVEKEIDAMMRGC
jgi:hypothetical protein